MQAIRIKYIDYIGYSIFALIALPMLMIMLHSFVYHGQISIHWYYRLVQNNLIIDGFKYSMFISMIASLIATFMGTMMAFGMYFYSARNIGNIFIISTIAIPDVIIAVASLASVVYIENFLHITIHETLPIVMILGCFATPYVAIVVYDRIKSTDPNMMSIMRIMTDRNNIYNMSYAVMRSFIGCILCGLILSFMTAFDDLLITGLLSIDYQSVNMVFFAAQKSRILLEFNALYTIFIAVICLIGLFCFKHLDLTQI